MHRRKFIKNTCLACITGFAMADILQSCGTTQNINATINGENILVNLSDFTNNKKGKIEYKKYIIIHNDQLQYPICIYRQSEAEYTALLMRCTHQGTELQVFGDKLQCPAHGAEFSNTGKVEGAPATENLRTFPITIIHNQLKISLK